MSVLLLSEAKRHLNVTSFTDDEEIQATIDAAEAAIAARPGVGPLGPESVASRVAGGGRVLLLPVRPAVSLTSVTPTGGSALSLPSLYLDAASGTVAYTSDSSFSASWYDVVYTAGRAACPPDLLFAAKELTRHMWDTQRGNSPSSALPADDQQFSPLFPGAFPLRVEELLTPYMSPAGFA